MTELPLHDSIKSGPHLERKLILEILVLSVVLQENQFLSLASLQKSDPNSATLQLTHTYDQIIRFLDHFQDVPTYEGNPPSTSDQTNNLLTLITPVDEDEP